MNKKMYFFILLLVWITLGLSGCGQQERIEEEDKLQIVCTIFPEYDWVREILGERTEEVELTLLMKNGADLHSYQPTVWDLKKIAEADLFLYVGGESDVWVEAALKNNKNPQRKTLNLLEILGEAVKEEEHVEGMQTGRGQEHEEEKEADEHVWLSLQNAEVICEKLTEMICELDTPYGDYYRQQAAGYEQKLRDLDQKYQEVVEQAHTPVLLFGDRFPFRYLTEDYGMEYYAAFAGCSAETEASFETITFLAEKTEELSLPAVLKIDGSDGKIARTIAGNTKSRDQKVLMLDSMQSVSTQKIAQGSTYLSIMEQNLEVLREALQ